MALTPEEKAERARQRMLDSARQYSTGTYRNRYVAPVFQKMIRAEAAALPSGTTVVVVHSTITEMYRNRGECCCVTCGNRNLWNSGLGGMHTGHYPPGRYNSIIFCEDAVAPQCSRCNRYESGAPERFRMWIEYVRGPDVLQRLALLKNEKRQFMLEELVDLRISFKARLDDAVRIMHTVP